MAKNQYTYAVARIRSKELTLLNNQILEQLIASKSYDECIRLLQEKGWGNQDTKTAEEILGFEHEKTWELMEELVDDISVFDVFLYANDYHNLKAAIKQAYVGTEIPNIYLSHGTVKVEDLYTCVKENDFEALPDHMREAARDAYQVLFHTGDGQLCDVIIDKAALKAIYKRGKASDNEVLAGFAELKVVASNINIAIRGNKTRKGIDFFQRALAECDTLDIQRLTEAALDSESAIHEYLSSTIYSDAVAALKESLSAFERWCDNRIMEFIKPQRYNPFTISPLAAFILGRESEMKSVRILLSGKLNDLSENLIRERLRETYV